MKKVTGVLALLAVILGVCISSSHAFELNGFANVLFTKSVGHAADAFRNGDFAIGTLDLYLAENLDAIEILSELVVEEGTNLDLERITIGYTFSDALKIRAGRFHTPLGLWNISYHHGALLQPTIDRPEFLKFEDDGGILPTHVVGVYLSGKVKTGVGGLEYGAMIGNGPKITLSDDGKSNVLNPNNTADNNIGKAVAFNLILSPEPVQGLKVGVSGHISRVESDSLATTAVGVDQTILNASAMYEISNIDFMGEFFSIQDKDVTKPGTGSFTNSAYYGLIRYIYEDKWIPYILWEQVAADENDPYMVSLGKNHGTTEAMLGLRYNINYRSAINVEARQVKEESNNWNEYAAQWALAF